MHATLVKYFLFPISPVSRWCEFSHVGAVHDANTPAALPRSRWLGFSALREKSRNQRCLGPAKLPASPATKELPRPSLKCSLWGCK